MQNLNSWLSYLETLHPKLIDPGLERVAEVAQRADLLTLNCRVITVAGTNGKGSCVALLESILLAQGYRVGSYTSPHLLSYNERVKINGKTVDDALLCQAFTIIDEKRATTSLSYFEFGTLAAFQIFKQANLDIVILEVGMGGRLDAVNIIDADISIVSTVELDHVEWLGDTREKIAYEKAGIFRADKYAVCGDCEPPQSLRDHAKKVGAKLYCQGEDFGYQKTSAQNWSWQSRHQQLIDLPIPKIDLQNAATVLMAIELLQNIKLEAIKEGLKNVYLPGRFQIIEGRVTTILDVAHNPAAAELLAKKLQETAGRGKTLAVVAMLSDKDQAGTVTYLMDQIASWYVAGLAVPRGGTAQCLADHLLLAGAKKIQEFVTVNMAYNMALAQANPGDRIIVFGSFYTVAEVLRLRL